MFSLLLPFEQYILAPSLYPYICVYAWLLDHCHQSYHRFNNHTAEASLLNEKVRTKNFLSSTKASKQGTMALSGESNQSRGTWKTVLLSDEANLLIRVGAADSGGIEIKVNSAVMSIGSGYFRTLLRSNFREASSRIVEMPEDDPELFLDYCRILHRDLDATNKSPAWFMGIAKIAEMRVSTSALRAEIRGGLEAVLAAFSHLDSMKPQFFSQSTMVGDWLWRADDLISLSAVFDFDVIFYQLTRLRLLYYKVGIDQSNSPSYGPEWISPHEFYNNSPSAAHGRTLISEALEDKAVTICTEIHRKVRECIRRATGLVDGPVNADEYLRCERARRYVRLFWRGSRIASRFNNSQNPLTKRQSVQSLCASLRTAVILRDDTAFADEDTKDLACSGESCSACLVPIKAKVIRLAQKHVNLKIGMCLGCFKEDAEDCWTSVPCPKHTEGRSQDFRHQPRLIWH